MANISTASGYATFEADTREVVQQLMEAVKPMSENDSYPTDFRWDDDRWPNSEGTRVKVGFVGFGRWAFNENVQWMPGIVEAQNVPELERERWSVLWDFSDMESGCDFCSNCKILVEHPAGVPVGQSTLTVLEDEVYARSTEGHSLLRYPSLY